MLLFTWWETFSVEELLPTQIRRQPGRYLLEYGFALLACLIVTRPQPRAALATATR